MEERKQIIHVLMVTFAAQGHINPMLRLGKHLQTKGIHVTLATTDILRHRFLNKNHHSSSSTTTTTTTTAQIPSISGIDLEFFSDGLGPNYDRKNNLDTYLNTLAEFGPINLSNLITSLSSNQTTPKNFSCIINTPFVPWVADVADRHGIPCAMLWIQPCTLLAIYHRLHTNPNDFPTKENPEKSVKLQGLPLLNTCDLPSFVLPSNPYGGVPKIILKSIKNLHKLRWVLANSFYELEKEVIDLMSKLVKIKGVGPLIPLNMLGQDIINNHDFNAIDMWKPDDKCIDWLNQKEPSSVIYVSFGSVVVLSKRQMEILATALRNSKRPFIWVVKQTEYDDDQVGEGAGKIPEGFLDAIKDQGLIVNWCQQSLVLLHKSVACFLTHCGWNSMLETISCGVPVIAYPFWTDQPTNAKLMADVFGAGLRLWPDKDGLVGSEEIEMCIDEIIEGPKAMGIRAQAAKWKRLARDAVAGGGSSDWNIQGFIDDIVKISSPST